MNAEREPSVGGVAVTAALEQDMNRCASGEIHRRDRADVNDAPLVALFAHSLECGGVERITVNMAQFLASRGYRVDMLLRVAVGDFLTDLPATVRVVELGRSRMRTLLRLSGYLRRERPRALLALMYPQNEVALVARWLAGTRGRTIVSVRSMLGGQEEIVGFRWSLVRRLHAHFVRLLARVCYAWADGIVTVSEGAGNDVAHVTGLPRSRVVVIRNPVIRPQLFARAAEGVTHPWLAGGGPPVILGVGRLHRIKDFGTLIEAFSLVRAQRKARLVILGEGPERPALQRLARKLGVDGDVDLPGVVANPYPEMRSAKVLALTSRFDALPAVLVEALALGTPIVATDCPSGPAEILRGGRYGELVPVGDPAGVAAAIMRVLTGRSAACPVDPAWLDQFREETAMRRYLELLMPHRADDPGVGDGDERQLRGGA
jgi:glycosyltransferase involved in cell wall biosynthesis